LPRNMYRIEINIFYKRIVRQVGHLPELVFACLLGRNLNVHTKPEKLRL